MTENDGLSHWIAEQAHRLGFDAVSITACTQPRTLAEYRSWIQLGYHGNMAYLARPDAMAKRSDVAGILDGTRTIICVAANYHIAVLPKALREDPSRGIIASYVGASDYHDVLLPRLDELAGFLRAQMGQPVAFRSYVDTGPLLERDMAARAGLGFVGKNSNLILPGLGSWLFLGEILTTANLAPVLSLSPVRPGPQLPVEGTCGQCTRCLDACPTGALVAPYVLDARRCISYLTIELKSLMPRRFRGRMGNRIFGCDICQQVCPWNKRFARPTTDPAFRAPRGFGAPALLDLMTLSDSEFRERFGGTSVERTKRRGLLRNVAIALGNWGDPAATPVLKHALTDSEPLIRGHAAWALAQLGTPAARRAVETALTTEEVPWVRTELEDARKQFELHRVDQEQSSRDI